jgi:hypothetical protein
MNGTIKSKPALVGELSGKQSLTGTLNLSRGRASGDITLLEQRITALEEGLSELEECSVFVGDANTTFSEFYEAARVGKVCFMRRAQGGYGITPWTMFNYSTSAMTFYQITSNGKVQCGTLLPDDSFNYEGYDVKKLQTQVGNIDTALDSIIAIQESLIGGDSK